MFQHNKALWPDDYSPPNWLPDWRDLEEYHRYPHWLKPEEYHRYFAWQFLRRKPDYQSTYDLYLEFATLVDEMLGNGGHRYVNSDGIALKHEGKKYDELDRLLRPVLERYCLSGYLFNPSIKYLIMPPVLLGSNVEMPRWFNIGETRDHHRIVKIDLRFPLQYQIESAKIQLRAEQTSYLYEQYIEELDPPVKLPEPSYRKRKTDTLVRYLRILDADAIGLKDSDICKTLYPPEKNALTYSQDKQNRSKNPRIRAREDLKKDRKEAYHLLNHTWITLLS